MMYSNCGEMCEASKSNRLLVGALVKTADFPGLLADPGRSILYCYWFNGG